ncbi:REP element-mobilizing transposase RayT [Flavobacterium nitrogenifigens]|uniref:REP element-mobilizing transposase RayT n=2 Tax=Flavobacterium TaxID=237 RepID=A0A7W7IUK2_9FLAO|nr:MULTISPECIES: transposase [Flavobacterium]MBB4800842.1 REP element-mobilizing transposase RayT [Flavobacterium nitrogenifigens]MBB6385410.1 REP element-mobilizing transposase RayT [Flavobacterium notoginsengisoli]
MSQGKFQNKYRISSIRAQWWDYGWNGAYFITICTQDRKHYFGEIQNNKMILSHAGIIADLLWHQIPSHHKNVELGDFVVMPNHIHGILIINKPLDNANDLGMNHLQAGHLSMDYVQTGHALSQHVLSQQSSEISSESNPGSQRFQNIGKNTISSIVGSYKSAVTKHANRLGYPHQWQKLFYDNIIRSNNDYQRISDYIVSNPEKWAKDKFKTEDKSK